MERRRNTGKNEQSSLKKLRLRSKHKFNTFHVQNYERKFIAIIKPLHYIRLHYITSNYITLHYITLHCTALHCIASHCIALHYIREAAWSSGLGRWIWNLEVPGSNPPPYYCLDLFSVVPSSTPRPRCVNDQLVSLSPVGILNSLCCIYNICLLFTVSPISTTVLNTLDT